MEGDGERKTATDASERIVENPNNSEAEGGESAIHDTSRSREEGELSSSDDEELPTGSASLIKASSGGLEEPVQVGAVNNSHKAGIPLSSNEPVSSTGVVPGASQLSNHHKSSEKNREPFVPFVSRFSDNESSSDSEDSRQKNRPLIKVNNHTTVGGRTSQASSQMKFHKSEQTTRNQARTIPRKVSLSRNFVSSLNTINTAAPKNVKPSHNIRKSYTYQKIANQDHGHKTNVHFNASKLQDLRQLIAIRESQLKLKSSQQSKNLALGSFRDNNLKNVRQDMTMEPETTSVGNSHHELREPYKKRQKTSEHPSVQMASHGREDRRFSQSTIAPNKLGFQAQQGVDDHRNQEEEIPSGSRHSIRRRLKKQDGNQKHVSSNNPPTGIIQGKDVANHNDSGKNAKLDGDRVVEENAQTSNGVAKTLPFKYNPKKSVSLSNPSSQNHSSRMNVPGNGNMDIQTLLELEELQEKELEEAQEHRHKCEVEERNALKAYKKTQRALVEANARCSYLYTKRELYSAQLRSYMMENPNLFSSMSHDQFGQQLNLENCVPVSSCHPLIMSNVEAPALHCLINSRSDALENLTVRHVDEQNMVVDPCSEPDDSASVPEKVDDEENGACSPSDGLSVSGGEDDEIYQAENNSMQRNVECQENVESTGERERTMNDGSEKQLSGDISEDPLLLEASLRSQLFERMRMNILQRKRALLQSTDLLANGSREIDDNGDKIAISQQSIPFSETETSKNPNFQVTDHSERYLSLEDQPSTATSIFWSPILRSAFYHLKVNDSIDLVMPQTRSPKMYTSNNGDEKDNGSSHNERWNDILSQEPSEVPPMDTCSSQVSSFSSDIAIDPFWPLCMYELRGKCNDDDCAFQHIRDYSSEKMNHRIIKNDDCQVGSPSERGHFSGGTAVATSLNSFILAPPTYLVGLDVLKSDLKPFHTIVAQSYGQCWQKCFSAFLVLSNILPSDLHSEEPFLHGIGARVEVHGGWNRQSFYFHSRNESAFQVDQGFTDSDQQLEKAVMYISQETNKSKGRIQALKVLARALESDPKSKNLWIVYLLSYYSNQKSIGKDDMFKSAVEQISGSYELWLLYINSRQELNDRLAAYDDALVGLSRHAPNIDGDPLHASECILDIFLQMINYLCISSNVAEAIDRINGLSPTSKRIDNSRYLLHDIVACLTISDKCTFWICCVFFVVYKKLPDAIVHRFECHKELPALRWPYVHLTMDEKQQAVPLMELAVDSLALHIDSESLRNEATVRAIHMFSVNHVSFVILLEGLECGQCLLKKYTKLYPSCIELALMAARAEYHFGSLNFEAFEEALGNWSDEVPGVQCIWNQYAQCVLQSKKIEFARELLTRWLESIRRMQDSQTELLESVDSESFNDSTQPASVAEIYASFSSSTQIDILFGLLNLSLYKLLHNDHHEARLAINMALEVSDAANYSHCVREHIYFQLAECLQQGSGADSRGILSIMKSYLVDARATIAFEPLSRNFILEVNKPRVRQLVGKLLCPMSLDSSLINIVLEAWYGPSLLPQRFNKITDLVDIVETMMELVPSNYWLAMSVCKLLSKNSNAASPCMSFWASSLLANALFQAIPVAPEYVWLEAIDVLKNLMDSWAIAKCMHKRALSVYPFSVKLWKSYLEACANTRDLDYVKEAVKERGIKLE